MKYVLSIQEDGNSKLYSNNANVTMFNSKYEVDKEIELLRRAEKKYFGDSVTVFKIIPVSEV